MREQGLAARRKRRRRSTTRPGKGRWRAPDLVKRDFPATGINQKWYGDGTGIPADEGKLYLASVLDMASRRVPGFALGEHHDAQLAYGALAMAVTVRGGQVPGVIMHTDQGSEYTAGTVRAACGRLGIRQSMGRPGSALDNAVIESWHSTLESGLRSVEHFATKAAARARIPAWIDDYNHHRRHSALRMMPPVEYEKTLQAGKSGLTWLPLPAPEYRPVPGSIQVVPPQPAPTAPGLRGLHLDTACAPAVTWQLSEAGPKARSAHTMCPRFQGNPEGR